MCHNELGIEDLAKDGMLLGKIDAECRTLELCTAACDQNGLALQFAPDNIINDQLCFDSCSVHSGALRYVPDRLFNERIISAAVSCHPGCICWFDPVSMRAREDWGIETSNEFENNNREVLKKFKEEIKRYDLEIITQKIIDKIANTDKDNEDFEEVLGFFQRYGDKFIEKGINLDEVICLKY